ncbi:hypothetical protein YC2023_039379 [Brassica napus]
MRAKHMEISCDDCRLVYRLSKGMESTDRESGRGSSISRGGTLKIHTKMKNEPWLFCRPYMD